MKNFLFFISLILISVFDSFAQQGWYQLNSGTSNNLMSVCFTDINTGYAAGLSGTILKTTNGGLNWTSQSAGTSENLYSVHFMGQTGYVVGGAASSVIYKTTDGGINWVNQSVAGASGLNSVFVTGSLTAHTVGTYGSILSTTNGGNNWNAQNISDLYNLKSIFFIDASTGFIGGVFHMHAGGIFLQTNNGGGSWTSNYGSIHSIYFVNSVTGFSAAPRRVEKTTNSGINWTTYDFGNGNQLTSIRFTSPTTGYTAGYFSNSGIMFKTINGGSNWDPQVIPSVGPLNSLYFIDANTGYAAGNSGTILKTTNGGVIGLEPLSNEVPNEYKLQQNYPNPFNPVTRIRFQLKNAGAVNLAIYDMLGRELELLVNEELKPGTYEIEWNAANLPSGVYFYRLSSSEFREIRKAALIK